MSRTRIKACGLMREDDVRAAVAAGVDACGFIFAPSPRQLSIERAAELAGLVPPPVGRIGVFVDAHPAFIASAVRACGLTAVQMSGSESPEDCDEVDVPVVKVVKVGTDFGWKQAEPYRGHAAALLLDTFVAGKEGGTSQSFAWNSIGEAPGWAPVFVAGGLDPHNVGLAIAALRPFAVDVSSGVESAPAIKDPEKIVSFVAAVWAADEEVYGR